MSTTYRTKDGDMLDEILWSLTGSTDRTAEVLALNPGLADLGPIFDEGIQIRLPDPAPAEPVKIIRLWGNS